MKIIKKYNNFINENNEDIWHPFCLSQEFYDLLVEITGREDFWKEKDEKGAIDVYVDEFKQWIKVSIDIVSKEDNEIYEDIIKKLSNSRIYNGSEVDTDCLDIQNIYFDLNKLADELLERYPEMYPDLKDDINDEMIKKWSHLGYEDFGFYDNVKESSLIASNWWTIMFKYINVDVRDNLTDFYHCDMTDDEDGGDLIFFIGLFSNIPVYYLDKYRDDRDYITEWEKYQEEYPETDDQISYKFFIKYEKLADAILTEHPEHYEIIHGDYKTEYLKNKWGHIGDYGFFDSEKQK
jgi:hypothetical protein